MSEILCLRNHLKKVLALLQAYTTTTRQLSVRDVPLHVMTVHARRIPIRRVNSDNKIPFQKRRFEKGTLTLANSILPNSKALGENLQMLQPQPVAYESLANFGTTSFQRSPL